MKRTILMMLVALPLGLGACGQTEKEPAEDKSAEKTEKTPEAKEAKEVKEAPEAPEALDPRVEKAVTVANAIAKDPDSADAILEKNGLDRDTFEALMYEIAKDPELSELYAVNREA
ncbi:MAG TPA: hypothetical protein ENK31_08025 [Nannocystis exedens]|nr:hypothetical protein [Nannocystis exedens]